jgi:hypothetical protein
MIGKPYPLVRNCWQCSHSHATNLSCDEARRLRAARAIVDFALCAAGALVLYLCVLAWRALNLGA